MAEITLTKTRISSGVWEGVLTSTGPRDQAPVLAVTHLNEPVPGHEISETGPGQWMVQIPIPPELIADGVQTFVVSDPETGDVLETFALVTGEPLADDLRAEIDLLRAELDMLKRAFRRHCVETVA